MSRDALAFMAGVAVGLGLALGVVMARSAWRRSHEEHPRFRDGLGKPVTES